MVKAPSSHGLDRKYKPWRKGKSEKAKANKGGSLKRQLRGQERLLGKVLSKQQQNAESSDDAAKQRIEELQERVQELKQQIAAKETQEKERQNARESHGTRFLERQRLTRMQRTVQKEHSKSSSDTTELELKRITLDQIYVAHYPFEIKKYKPLLRKGNRLLDGTNVASHIKHRAKVRTKILQDLHHNRIERVPWISKEQYDLLPAEWTVQLEMETFDYNLDSKLRNKGKTKKATDDSRFALSSTHNAVLDVANQIESELNEQGQEEEDSDSDGDDDDDDDGDPNEENQDSKCGPSSHEQQVPLPSIEKGKDPDSSSDEDLPQQRKRGSDSELNEPNHTDPTKSASAPHQRPGSDSSDSDSSSDEEDIDPLKHSKSKADPHKKPDAVAAGVASSTSSSSSDSDSSSSEENDEEKKEPTSQNRTADNNKHDQKKHNDNNDDDDDDDFLVPAEGDEPAGRVFEKAKEHLPAENPAQGDKSQGWKTQRQRPGQFKKRRVRR